MKRLVSTWHTGSDTAVNRHAGWGETWKHTGKQVAFKSCAKRGNIHISTRQYLPEFTLQFGCTLLINDASRRSHSYSHAHARANSRVWDDTNDILFVIWTNIMYYGPNCFCTLLCAHTRTGDHQIWTRLLYFFPLNVFPIDHCSKDVINNLKAWLTSTFP